LAFLWLFLNYVLSCKELSPRMRNTSENQSNDMSYILRNWPAYFNYTDFQNILYQRPSCGISEENSSKNQKRRWTWVLLVLICFTQPVTFNLFTLSLTTGSVLRFKEISEMPSISYHIISYHIMSYLLNWQIRAFHEIESSMKSDTNKKIIFTIPFALNNTM
jgi:hypothetical protein